MTDIQACNRCGIDKPLTEYHKHPRSKNGVRGICKDCCKISSAQYRDANREKRRASSLAWAANNPERHLANAKRYHEEHRDQALEKMRRYAEEGRYLERQRAYRETNREIDREKGRAKYRADPAVSAEKAMRRAAAKRRGMPKWANLFFIQEAYRLARLRRQTTGFPWHVDHIVPLNSPLVCGLHVESNLRVIPGPANLAKGNRYWPDMP